MERNSTVHKIIFGILDVLLVIGAIVSVVTIDGGQWLFNNPAFVQPPPPAEARQYPPLSLDAQPRNMYEIIPQTGNPCPEETPATTAVMDESLSVGAPGVVAEEAFAAPAMPKPTATANPLCDN